MNGRTCRTETATVKISSIKTGSEKTGKHVDTQIIFFVDREKAVCHFYHTTQLIMVNGHAYKYLAKDFLIPFFQTKINNNEREIKVANEQAVQNLIGKTVKHRTVSYNKKGSLFPCKKCQFVSSSVTALGRHCRMEHSIQLTDHQSPDISAIPIHSTTNNSMSKVLLQEDISISDLTQVDSMIENSSQKEALSLY